jgi:hypothetical protein
MDTCTESTISDRSHRPSNTHGSRGSERAKRFEAGMFRSLQRHWTARWTARATEAETEILGCQINIAEQHRKIEEVELETRYCLAQAAYRAETEEAELELHRKLQAAEAEEARSILQRETEIGIMLQSRSALKLPRQTVMLSVEAPLPALPPPPEPVGVIDVHLSDTQIEALAVQAIARLGQMVPDHAERAWADWHTELHRKLPPYAADEVIRRADDLRHMVR